MTRKDVRRFDPERIRKETARINWRTIPSIFNNSLISWKKQQPEPRPSFAVCLLWDPMNTQFLEIFNHAIHQNIYILACKISALSSLVASNSLVLLFLSQLEMSALQQETFLVGIYIHLTKASSFQINLIPLCFDWNWRWLVALESVSQQGSESNYLTISVLIPVLFNEQIFWKEMQLLNDA